MCVPGVPITHTEHMRQVAMSDIDLLSDEYTSLQERYDQMIKNPPASEADLQEALRELAETARELKKIAAEIGMRYEKTTRPDGPNLRLKKDGD